MQLRDYQQQTIAAIWNYFMQGNTGNPVAALPTGTGKSVIIAGFVHGVFQHFPNQRIMMVTHVKELIEQNFDKLLKVWSTAPAGIYSAGVGRKDTTARITFAGIQSVVKKAHVFKHIDLLLIDECHLVSHKADTSYRSFIEDLKVINPNLKVIGFSATPYRLGLGSITEGGIFTDICIDLTTMEAFNWFIDEGYLVPLIPKRTSQELSIEGVKMSGGEYNSKELQEAVDKQEITYNALKEMAEAAADRKYWLIFATGVEHAHHIAEMLESMGISAQVVHGAMGKGEREKTISDFKAGKFRALVNNNVLTTGFDMPDIDCIGMLRPTASPGLWVQMLGRGTRPVYAEGFDLSTSEGRLAAISASPKQNCLVLDFAGNTMRLGPVNDPRLPKKKGKGGGPAPVRVCDVCATYMHPRVLICPCCGKEFPPSVNFTAHAGTAELIAKDLPIVEEFKVDRVTYAIHRKEGKPDAIKAAYHCGLRTFHSYCCLEHGGFASRKAREWWRQSRKPQVGDYLPASTNEAMANINALREPLTIKVWINKKYPEIMSMNFGD